jgi:hypothetical protein
MPKKGGTDKAKKAAPALSEADEAARKLKIKRIKEIAEQSFSEAQVVDLQGQSQYSLINFNLL